MSQSISTNINHIVFSTKYREHLVSEEIRPKMQAYIIGVLSKKGSYVHEIYMNPDHLHVLCTLPKPMSIPQLISAIKIPTSKWTKNNGIPNFRWQDGYGSFSVSRWDIDMISNYIRNQPKHHNNIKSDFKEEYRGLLKKHEVEFDEKYVWD